MKKHHPSFLAPIKARLSLIGAAVTGRALALPKTTRGTTVGDFTPIFWAGRRMTPEEVRSVLQRAIGGNIQEQWALFDMMEETWPRLAKNLSEVRRAASRVTFSVQPYAERGEKPSDSAKEKADLVECALRNWRPKPGTLELGFEDALFNALDALGKGLSVLEIAWQRSEEGLLPLSAHLLHPRQYGWNDSGTELGLISSSSGYASNSSATWQEFPPGQFWVGVWHARSGAPGQTALLRSLAPYWCGITFGWEWLLNNAQIFGVPFRWATYDPNNPQNKAQLSEMLANLGSAGWAAFPNGTTLEFKEAVQRASDNPQVFIQELADKYCDQLVLGQEASSETKPAGIGSGASDLHGSVRDQRLQDAAQWCADLLNYQLVPALLRMNWGDESEPPTIVPDMAGETDPKAKADRDQVLAGIGLKIPTKYLYERHGIPEPEEGDETIGGEISSQLPAGPASESAAPGGSGDAVLPETADPDSDEQRGQGNPQNRPENARGGMRVATRSSKRASVDSPESAEVLAKASKSDRTAQNALPGDYRMPAATAKALAQAHAKDFAPFRKAAEPLLAAIEGGNLAVIGELEAFIARLDAMAPDVIGASELADSLEEALSEATIAGAAGTYRKISKEKP